MKLVANLLRARRYTGGFGCTHLSKSAHSWVTGALTILQVWKLRPGEVEVMHPWWHRQGVNLAYSQLRLWACYLTAASHSCGCFFLNHLVTYFTFKMS